MISIYYILIPSYEKNNEMSPLVADKFRDSIVFAGADTTVIRFFEYPSEKNLFLC